MIAILLSLASSSGGPGWLLAAGPAAGVGTYVVGYRYYRNTQASHSFERETRIQSQPVSGNDAKIGENNGTRQSSVDGDNRSDHRRRVQRG
ncbi:MAG: hypothetical protein QM733_06160 [Ilumatobacteraceae bacterium]